ncbi:MAG: uL15 family ribosomal protein [Candidatus Aenigmarchaeota archaeon]|nr:uL15 family ribosomal protein [Candidatus Aenigmarchaeota archaeon]
MTTRKRKKSVKERGYKSHGYGAKPLHRGSGSKGGKGHAGVFKHKKSWIFKYEPGLIGGKKGFSSKKKRGIVQPIKAINLRDLAKLAKSSEINVSDFGYNKVLAAGNLTKSLTVKAKFFSAGAQEKIEKAGGKAVKE